MQDEDIRRAEKRVMEMNRMTKQLAEQGSRYIQNNGNDRRRSAFSLPERTAPLRGTAIRTETTADRSGRTAAVRRPRKLSRLRCRFPSLYRSRPLRIRKAAAGRRKYFPLSGWTANSFGGPRTAFAYRSYVSAYTRKSRFQAHRRTWIYTSVDYRSMPRILRRCSVCVYFNVISYCL